MQLLSRTRTRLPALVTLMAVLCPAPAWGLEFTLFKRGFTLDLTDTLTYAYNADNNNTFDDDDDYHLVLNKLDINLSLGDLRLGGRFDMYLFVGEPVEADDRFVNRFAPQQVYFMVARPEFDITMGDFYATLGKGIALSVVKIDELGQDTTIRGGKFTYHDHGLGVMFLAGQFNPLALDSATGWVAPWDPEPLVAGRLEYNFFEKVLVGAHAMYHFIDDPGSSGAAVARTDHDVVWGVGLEIPELFAGVLSLAAEVDLQQSVVDGVVIRGPGAEGELDGIAAYASASSQLGDLTLLAEYKYYDNFELRARSGANEPYTLLYHHPPTLERLTADIKDNTSIWGAHLRADYNLGQRGPVELLVAANYGYFEDWAEGSDLTIHDPFGSVELTWQEGKGKLEVESGVRRTYDNDNDKVKFQDIHLELNMEQSLASRHSLKLTFSLLQRSRAEFISEDEWKEMDLALSYKWSPHLLLAFTFERQEDPKEVRDHPENYFGGVVRYYVTPSTYINVRGGQNRGGIKCYLGTCRYVPPFSGAEVQAVVRY